ncbi:TIM barrel protein [Yoonia sp.]|uniref:hydroxypyruvate isomerase family protein n=1 Tax=Yoonia sp. TaxID=2212373 RepID=UPI0019F60921|nr:TIM barrel protein [Yoonia sp.]MBE0413965.1 TIM barrel protein [Yoonia sp.]
MKFSANLGFLWADLPLPDAIRAAKAGGFDAVECHWPYDYRAADILAVLQETGLPICALNTRRGDVAMGENGLAALPGREAEARAAIDEAVRFAAAVRAGAVHVMAGIASGAQAQACFLDNLAYACDQAAPHGLTILIEPLNRHDAPGYFLRTTGQARALIATAGRHNLKLMFDCYHVARTEGDVTMRLADLLPVIGHIQCAGVPDRGPLDRGELNYDAVFATLKALGWQAPLGAEYRTNGPTEQTLGWLRRQKAR